jgi:hypothetical protein
MILKIFLLVKRSSLSDIGNSTLSTDFSMDFRWHGPVDWIRGSHAIDAM